VEPEPKVAQVAVVDGVVEEVAQEAVGYTHKTALVVAYT
jgi:hypothetical protein